MNSSNSETREVVPSSPRRCKKYSRRSRSSTSVAYRTCEHWECGMNECIFKMKSESRERSGPLHLRATSSESTLPPASPEATEKTNIIEKMKDRVSESPKSRGRLSDVSTTSTMRSSTSSQRHIGRKASFALSDIVGKDTTDRSIGDRSSSSIVSGCSAEFKASVTNLSMVDNTNAPGTYTGTIDRRTKKPHGHGTMVYADSIYEGQWVNGDWNGFGSLIELSTGNSYQGGFFDNMKHGLGVMKYSDGRIYDGVFMLDKLDKKGTLMKGDGTKYWGYWSREGVPHGRGKMEYADGRVFDGEFDQGIRSGHGRMTYPDGSWYLGEWCDGEQNGLGMEVNTNGDLVHEGMYSNGKPIEASSMPQQHKSSGQFLLYRSSVTTYGGGTLVGPLPRQLYMRPGMNWATKNL